ncbi:DUF1223 domain-containing protein [Rhodovibrio salinarum]|uniref:DUF1223 domain-containing protein n=1 Tax=Rhodovibrio salinarum TaxID=1087 RepID=A0A934QHK9_9PROT|nr:DUF1223 domain-containing protein [Rhodovibrio salinarum]MBK1697009.1 DUF1223 domain-containing protein [Rhodovibrio salinarum]
MARRFLLLAFILLLLPPARLLAAEDARSVVVELFTSQGCSSCPPADRLLGELKGRPGVIALSLHVDYWDYIGWQDPYGLARHTNRQQAYRHRLGLDYVYTPQIVVDGALQAVGSRRQAVLDQLARARQRPSAVRPQLAEDRAVIPAATVDREARVWLVTFDARHATDVADGENAGDRLVNHNVVRSWQDLGAYTGARRDISLDLAEARAAGRSGCALLVQQDGTGAILGAAMRRFDEG